MELFSSLNISSRFFLFLELKISPLTSQKSWSPYHREAKTATLARLLAGGLCCFVCLNFYWPPREPTRERATARRTSESSDIFQNMFWQASLVECFVGETMVPGAPCK